MAIGTFVAGPASVTWNSLAFGLTEQGWQLSISYAKELVNQSDRFGETALDAVFRGVSTVNFTGLSIEYTNNVLSAMTPYQATSLVASGVTFFDVGIVGVLDSDKAKTLIMTSLAGTTAATRPISLTATKAIIRENEQLQWAFDSRLRKVPLPFRLYPDLISGTYRFFTCS